VLTVGVVRGFVARGLSWHVRGWAWRLGVRRLCRGLSRWGRLAGHRCVRRLSVSPVSPVCE